MQDEGSSLMEFEEESKNNGLYNSNLSDTNPKIVFQAA